MTSSHPTEKMTVVLSYVAGVVLVTLAIVLAVFNPSEQDVPQNEREVSQGDNSPFPTPTLDKKKEDTTPAKPPSDHLQKEEKKTPKIPTPPAETKNVKKEPGPATSPSKDGEKTESKGEDKKNTPTKDKPSNEETKGDGPAKKAEKKKKKKKKKTVFIDYKKKTIRIEGFICVQRGLLEVFACTPRGKRHEAVAAFYCDPKQIHFALIVFGLKPRPQVKQRGEGKALSGDKVYAYLQWKDPKTKKETIYRAEDLIYNVRTQKTMKRVGWVFTGSRFVKHPVVNNDGKKVVKNLYMSSYSGNMITTFHSPNALLDNPLKLGGDDTVYYSNYLALPPRGHPVELILVLKPNLDWDKRSKPYDASKVKKKGTDKKKANKDQPDKTGKADKKDTKKTPSEDEKKPASSKDKDQTKESPEETKTRTPPADKK